MNFDNDEEFEKFLLEGYDETKHKENIMERIQDNPLQNINVCNINYIEADKQQSDEAKEVITTYVRHGPELNARLRGAPATQDLGFIRKNIVKSSRPINTTCKPDSYYIVYRAMTNIYDKDINQGFMSTSNILIPQFGNFHMKIYIPIKTPVLIRNISKETNINGAYEIVLPENTMLEPLGFDSLLNYNIYILQPQIGSGNISHRTPHFYINPLTGRVVRSDASVYTELKRRRFKLEADTCLYNVTSAKNCLTQIMNKYGNKVYPSNKFINIPSTYHRIKTKAPKARAFIKTKDKKYLKGYLDKSGKIFKLPKPIKAPKITIPEVTTIPEHQHLLDKKLETEGVVVNKTDITDIQEQLRQEPLSDKITILHNPIQDDFIPIKGQFDQTQQKELLYDINNTLIPSKLPSLNNTNISAILLDSNRLPTQIIGFTDINNNTVKFDTPIKINVLNQYEIIDNKKSEFELIPGPQGPQGERGIIEKIEPEPSEPSEPETSEPSETSETSEPSEPSETSEPETSEPETSEPETSEPEVEEKIESEIEKIKLSEEKIDNIPQIEIEKKEIPELDEATHEVKAEFLNEITKICGVNEQLEPTNNKCYPCEYYNLIWDSEFKKCKLKDKLLTIIEDTEGNILGYT
jgi:hypothetical protein